MPSLTYKRYMYAATNIKEFSLSQRYQMSENYRSAKLLTKVVWCFGITTVMAGILFVLSRVLEKPHRKIFQELYPLPFLIQSLFYPLLVMYYEPKVREFIICQKATNRIFIAKSITGQNLVISNTDEQREAYFHSYRQAWS
uniref:PrgI family protein n=1 Tax=Panagrolaimus sp. PS1159 TaxID=55785 RepID=A0AC35GJ16_9BILA